MHRYLEEDMTEQAKNQDEMTKYLLNRVRELERECLQISNENVRVKKGYSQRVKYLEDRKRDLENDKINMERELR